MCGDTQCPSCGPAQGNWRCPICRVWADSGCEHLDEYGALHPEFEKRALEITEEEMRAEEEMARIERQLASEYWQGIPVKES